MTIRLTPRQSKRAREMLRWNLTDVAARTRVPLKKFEQFERGMIRLMMPENDEIVRLYKKQGLIFRDDLDVFFAHECASADSKAYDADKAMDTYVSSQILSGPQKAHESWSNQKQPTTTSGSSS